jgi:pimeloyl-ACP methyl ester carboxylesterase
MSPLVFLGANGFPSKAYRPVLQRLSAIPIEYNHALVPGESTNWHPLIDTVISQCEAAAGSSGKGVTGVGHSAGGALLCCAAAVKPALFEHLIIVDSPMFNPLKRALFSVGFHLPDAILNRGHPMIKSAMNKQYEWPDRETAEK